MNAEVVITATTKADYVIIHSQDELDSIDPNDTREFCVRFGSEGRPAKINKVSVNPIMIDGNFVAEVGNGAHVIARKHAVVRGYDECCIEAIGKGVTVSGIGYGCTIIAWGSAEVYADNLCMVTLHDKSICRAYGGAIVHCYDNSTVYAHEETSIYGHDNSTNYLYKDARAVICDHARAYIGRDSLHSVRIKYDGKPANMIYTNYQRIGYDRMLCGVEL